VAGRYATAICAVLLTLAGLSAAAAQSRATAPAALPVATDIRLAGDDNQTRLVMDVTATIGLRAFTLADPYRVIIDIPQTVFQLPAKAGDSGRGLIKAYRYGLVMAGGSRIVIDVTKPVRIEKATVLDSHGGEPARLVLDLSATDREAFMRHLALDRSAMRTSIAVPALTRPQDKRTGDPRPLIVIDPGHGGPDTGTKAGGGEIMEKNVVLDFSLTLRDQLEKSGRYRVVMTRTDDTFIPLAERVKFARQRQAELFISVHADALPKSEGDVQGATIYTLSDTASDAEAAVHLLSHAAPSDGVSWIPTTGGLLPCAKFPPDILAALEAVAVAATPTAALEALGGVCVLTAQREFFVGAKAVSAAIDAFLSARPGTRNHPIIINRNDPETGLRNGTVGVFHRDDVYDWLAAATERGEQFDIVFSSYGAICWLSDLSTWAKGIATVLKPGGRFALVEFHPSLQALEEGWTPRYNAIGGQREDWSEGIGDYVGFMGDTLAPAGSGTGVVDFKNPEPSVEFAWSVAEVVTALLDAGLELRTLREYPYSNGFTPFHGFKELPGRRFTTPDDRPNIPMMYGVMATKPAG